VDESKKYLSHKSLYIEDCCKKENYLSKWAKLRNLSCREYPFPQKICIYQVDNRSSSVRAVKTILSMRKSGIRS
jgi:hypothetical protein